MVIYCTKVVLEEIETHKISYSEHGMQLITCKELTGKTENLQSSGLKSPSPR